MKTIWHHYINLFEELHPLVRRVLVNSEITPEEKYAMVANKEYRKGYLEPIDTLNKGSSRLYSPHIKHKEIILDNKRVLVKYGTKVALPLKLKYGKGATELGILQNKSESSDQYKPHYIIQANEKGYYKSNPKGILMPVLEKDKDNVWHNMLHAAPLEHPDYDIPKLTKEPGFPNGINMQPLMISLINKNKKPLNNLPVDEHLLTHPLAKKLQNLYDTTDISLEDLSSEGNWGTWIHPLTKKKHLAVIDYGASKDIMKNHY